MAKQQVRVVGTKFVASGHSDVARVFAACVFLATMAVAEIAVVLCVEAAMAIDVCCAGVALGCDDGLEKLAIWICDSVAVAAATGIVPAVGIEAREVLWNLHVVIFPETLSAFPIAKSQEWCWCSTVFVPLGPISSATRRRLVRVVTDAEWARAKTTFEECCLRRAMCHRTSLQLRLRRRLSGI
jgi:hypothetical protein